MGIITKKEFEDSINNDINNIINDITECCDLINKGDKLLSENKINQTELNQINEGLWEKIKYGLSKLGRYKAGGKIFGKGKIDQEAGAKIQSIIDKKGNEVIKALNTKIKETDPEFPNTKTGEQFLKTVMEIAAVYDSIVASTKKQPNEEGFLPIDIANGIIEDLAEYVKKFLDVDLAWTGSIFDSEEDEVDDNGKIDGGEKLLKDEVTDINEDEADDVRAKLQAKRGDGKERDSQRMDTLKSNKLPMTLAGIGASLGAFSWLVNTEWFKHLFDQTENFNCGGCIPRVTQEAVEVFDKIKPGQGMTQILNHFMNSGLSANSSPEDFLSGVQKLGGGNLQKGIEFLSENGGIFKDPDAAREVLTEIAKNPHGHGDTLGEIFKDKWAGTGKSIGDALVTVEGGTLKGLIYKTIVKAAGKMATTTVVKTGAGYLVAKGLGAVLGPIGIGLLTTGALVKLMRMKGQKQSRAKTLKDLLDSIQPVPPGKATTIPVLPPKPTKSDNSQLFNDLTSFFKFIVNNKKALSSGTSRPSPTTTNKGDINTTINKRGQMESINGLENLIFEARYIKDERTYKALAKSGELPFDKLKLFEEYLSRLELIRNKIKKMGETEDKVLNGFIQKMKSNPIMATDFSKMFDVPHDNADGVKSLKFFINDLFKTIYSGSYGKTGTSFDKIGGLVNKMGKLGSGNINKMEESYNLYEDKGYNVDKPNKSFLKDAQNRGSFKKHMTAFLSELMNMFQYLYKLKKDGKLSGDKKTGEKNEKSPKKTEESVKNVNPLLNEEVSRIKSLMFKIK
jgi:hypothetical protein